MNKRFVLLVLSLVLAGCPPPPPPDFRALAEKAYAEGATQDKPALDKLWSSLFKLKHWYFLASQTSPAGQPSVTTVDGEQWILVFTDDAFLGLYAGTHRTLLDGGPLPTTPSEPAQVPSLNVLEDGGSPFVANTMVPADSTLKTVHPHLGKDGKPLFVKMTPDEAVTFLNEWKGAPIKGVRFNEGSRKGWFAPPSALPNIRDMLKANGKL